MKEHFLSKLEGRQQLAVVDMAIPDKLQLANTIRKACIEAGFFYLINHGIDQDLVDEVFFQSKRFFDLSLVEKLKVLHDQNHRGYTPMAEEILDPLNSKQGDTKEGYYIGWDLSRDDPMAVKPLHGPNQWPSEDRKARPNSGGNFNVESCILCICIPFKEVPWKLLNQKLSMIRCCIQGTSELLIGWRESMEKYYFEVLKLGHAVTSLIALALDLEADYFKTMFTTPMVALRLLHYSAEISSPEEGKYGSGAHSDYGLLTFLATDSNPGLQICREKDSVPRVWEDVSPMKGAFIVNLGDMLERWTNGLFRSTLHRVLSSGVHRYSVPYFYEPNFDTLVECLPTCCSATNPPKYPPITSGGHLLGKYMDTHTGFDGTAKQVA